MARQFTKADSTTQQLLTDILHLHHHVLAAAEVRIRVVFVTDTGDAPADVLKLGGYACAAIVSSNSVINRLLGAGDALIRIDGSRWEDYDVEERKALLDHELSHLLVKREKGGICTWDANKKEMIGIPKLDVLGRPALQMRLHDWHIGGFRDVVQRWKGKALEMQQIRSLQDENGQYAWGWREKKRGGK